MRDQKMPKSSSSRKLQVLMRKKKDACSLEPRVINGKQFLAVTASRETPFGHVICSTIVPTEISSRNFSGIQRFMRALMDSWITFATTSPTSYVHLGTGRLTFSLERKGRRLGLGYS